MDGHTRGSLGITVFAEFVTRTASGRLSSLASEIEGINSIGKSVSVSFRVRVVRASGRARRSGVGAYGANASNAGGPVANICARPPALGPRLLRRRKGFKFFYSNCAVRKGFKARHSSGCAGARVLRECNYESFEHRRAQMF